MSERIEEYKDYRLRIKACQDCNLNTDPKTGAKLIDVDHTGKVKAVPGYFHPDKADVLVVFFQPEDIDHTRQQVTLYTGEKGKALGAAMDLARIAGNKKFGFTSLIKCKLMNGRVKRRVCKACMAKFFAYELEFLKPRIIVLCGDDVYKAVLPEIYTATPYMGVVSLEGKPFLALDQWYVFARDPGDCLSGKSYKPDDKKGELYGLASALQKARDL